MADKLGDIVNGIAIEQLVRDKSVSEIVDSCVFNPHFAKAARYDLSDISDQKRFAGSGYKKVIFI